MACHHDLRTTHDTKRSEDVRNRIAVISQYARQWRALLTKLARCCRTSRVIPRTCSGRRWPAPGPRTARSVDRMTDYMLKVAREQKLWTSWTNPDSSSEDRMVASIGALYADQDVMEAFSDWFEFTRESARETILSSKAIQLTCLGVADNYQSCETIQNYLVDPDNRRPVEVTALRAMAKELRRRDPRTLAEEKFHLTRSILRLRRRRPSIFVGERAHYSHCQVRRATCSASRAGPTASGRRGEQLARPMRGRRLAAYRRAAGGHWFDVVTGREYDGGCAGLERPARSFPLRRSGRGLRRRTHHHDPRGDGAGLAQAPT